MYQSPDLRFIATGTDVILGYVIQKKNPTLTLLLTAIEPHRVYTNLTATFSITL